MLYIYDKDDIFPKRIPFAFVIECTVCWARHRVAVWGYRFVDGSRKTAWECPSGCETGERTVRFAKIGGVKYKADDVESEEAETEEAGPLSNYGGRFSYRKSLPFLFMSAFCSPIIV